MMTRLPPTSSQRQQRGAALLLAMLIVTLVATLAGAMVWQQWRAVQVEAAERARTQSSWILVGALDWARLILREDNSAVDHLGEPWATPLAEARLSSFLAAENSSSDDGPEAFLSGSISDAQSHYNLSNLVAANKVVETELAVVERLFDNIGVAPSLAATIAYGLLDAGPAMSNLPAAAAAAPAAPASQASSPGSAGEAGAPKAAETEKRQANPNPTLRPLTLDQLQWLGVDEVSIAMMVPFFTLLPTQTKVNLNTASPEVIAASIEGLDFAGAQRLVQVRERSPFNNLANVISVLGAQFVPDDGRVGVTSNYFEVRGRLRLGERILEERSLVYRVQRQVMIVSRERVNLQQ